MMERTLMMIPAQPRRETAAVTLILQQKLSILSWSNMIWNVKCNQNTVCWREPSFHNFPHLTSLTIN